MNTVKTLALSRIKYHKSRTLLTAFAIMLTTMLLTALGTSAMGLLDINRQQAQADGNRHATLHNLTQKQVEMLKNHMDVEALVCSEYFATMENGKMNGVLTYRQTLKEGIYFSAGNLLEGRIAMAADEICSSEAFFKRMGIEPVVGNKITISFRPNGEGKIETREFTISGILSENISQEEIEKLDISDSRIVYGATVSEALVEEFITPEERAYMADIRVRGQEELNYDKIKARIETVAEAIGYDKKDIVFNHEYLYVMTDPGTETIQAVGAIALLIIVFSALAIYSIYYISVITDVQELGKLKALGASKKQMKKMLLTEGMRISFCAVPAGLLLGFLLPAMALPVIMKRAAQVYGRNVKLEHIRMFSLPILLLAAAAVFLTVVLSLLKPMRMASGISPIEAIRYQEGSGGKKIRQGKKDINVFRLCMANLIRNKKRTIVTMITMGLGCVLFMSIAGVMGSVSVEDIARRNIASGDFRLSLDYSDNDREYPENNLDSLQQENLFSDELLERIEAIDGVEKMERQQAVLIASDFPSALFEDGYRTSLSCISRADAGKYQKMLERGEIDYDNMIEENGAVCTDDRFLDNYGFSIGDKIPLTVYDGDRQLSLTVTLTSSVADGAAAGYFAIPEEVWDSLGLQYDAAVDLFITADPKKYDFVKSALQDIVKAQEHFQLYSMDEERRIGSMTVSIVKYPMYLILAMVAVIGFMNLINTMITSIVTRKRELGILQAVGLSDGQLVRMLAGEGFVFTVGTLTAAVTVGNLCGWILYLWAKGNHFMDLSAYHYPLAETLILILVLVSGQIGITYFIKKRIQKESLIDRIRSAE